VITVPIGEDTQEAQ
jgi:hypothetical protein